MNESRDWRRVRLAALTAIEMGVVARVFYFEKMAPELDRDAPSIGYDAWALHQPEIDCHHML